MIDDSSSERAAITKAWPSAVVLLCTFHFLQRRWTWLQDGQNKVDKNDRLILIEKLKNMVYANSESALESHYHKLLQTCPQATRYPHFFTTSTVCLGKETYMGTLLPKHSASTRKSYK